MREFAPHLGYGLTQPSLCRERRLSLITVEFPKKEVSESQAACQRFMQPTTFFDNPFTNSHRKSFFQIQQVQPRHRGHLRQGERVQQLKHEGAEAQGLRQVLHVPPVSGLSQLRNLLHEVHPVSSSALTFIKVQGDHSACAKLPVDFKTKVPPGQSGTFVLKSTGGFAQPEWSPCTFMKVKAEELTG